jgi:phosphate starvation-inducible membrane PsiE
VTETAVGIGVPAYVPDAIERFGRRFKMEYVGMASVFLTIWLLHFQDAAALAAMFFLFVALKKKTRDHLVTSFLMFAAAALAVPAVESGWGLPVALFAMLAWALEGWLEKRPGRIVTIPFVLGALGATTVLWPVGLAFAGAYLLQPRPDAPRLLRRLALLEGAGVVLAVAATLGVFGMTATDAAGWRTPSPLHLTLWLTLATPAALALVLFWRSLAAPHRLNALVAGALAPFDERMIAVFAIASTIVLAATVFRQSVESTQLRPHFKRAEWYYFWVILAIALGLSVSRLSAR